MLLITRVINHDSWNGTSCIGEFFRPRTLRKIHKNQPIVSYCASSLCVNVLCYINVGATQNYPLLYCKKYKEINVKMTSCNVQLFDKPTLFIRNNEPLVGLRVYFPGLPFTDVNQTKALECRKLRD